MKIAVVLKFLLFVAAAVAGAAQAHGLWIEQAVDTKTLFFGEPEVALKEKFPGRLESIETPQAMLIGADGAKTATEVARTANGFDQGASPATQSLLATDATMEVKDWTENGLGIDKPIYYARFAAAPQPGVQVSSLRSGPAPSRRRPRGPARRTCRPRSWRF